MSTVKLRVVKQVEGKEIGEEFYGDAYHWRFQIKHKSIEIVRSDEDDGGIGNGLTVAQIKAKLEELGIEIPAGAKKLELLALLSQ